MFRSTDRDGVSLYIMTPIVMFALLRIVYLVLQIHEKTQDLEVEKKVVKKPRKYVKNN